MHRWLLLFVLISLNLHSVEMGAFNKALKNFDIEYLYDKNQTHTIQSIQKVNFQRVLPSRFSLGYHDESSAHWFKITVTNRIQQDSLLLYFTNLYAKRFTYYYQQEGVWYAKEVGSLSQFNDSTLSDKNPKLTLPIAVDETKDIYIKLESHFSIVGEFIFFLNDKERLLYSNYYNYGFAFFFGALIFALAVNLFLFVTVRLKIYGYYVLHLGFFALFIITVNGLNNHFGLVSWVQPLHSLVPISLLLFVFFSINLLNLRAYIPKTIRLLDLLMVMLFIFMLFINFSISPWYMLMNMLGSVILAVLFIAAIMGVYKGVDKAKLYLIILILHIVSLAMMSNMYEGKLTNNDINQYSFMLVSLLEFVFFTFILANKINEESQEKHKIEEQKKVFETLFYDATDGILLVSNGRFIDCNDAAVAMFEYGSKKNIIGLKPIDLSPKMQPNGMDSLQQSQKWIQRCLERGSSHFEWMHKRANGEVFWSEIVLTKLNINDEHVIHVVCRDIEERKLLEVDVEAKTKELKVLYHNLQDSIAYAAQIQSAIIPQPWLLEKYFDEYFVMWKPKDTVGGDIYLFEELRHRDECLLMVIDCTGHGVPGAFVTMLVKAIEREIIGRINQSTEEVSPAKILQHFNGVMKKLLKQEDMDAVSDSGFDGGIVYINKKSKILRFAGAQTPFIYIEDNEVKFIKGDRHSIGYRKSKDSYEFRDHTVKCSSEIHGYLTTDGYIDQTGGEKGFMFGKKRLLKLIDEHQDKPLDRQKTIFIESLQHYQGEYSRKDDITLMSFRVNC
jgi:PAS domain S-box-containing protein